MSILTHPTNRRHPFTDAFAPVRCEHGTGHCPKCEQAEHAAILAGTIPLTRCQHGTGAAYTCEICPPDEQVPVDAFVPEPVLALVRPVPEPRRGVCPAWCRTDHAAAADTERQLRMRLHERQIPDRPIEVHGGRLRVTVTVVDDFDTGERGPVDLQVETPSPLSPPFALLLTEYLTEAAKVTGGERWW